MAAESSREEGGYDCQLVGDVEKNVHCTFCLQIFKDPQMLTCCQNHFCRSCIEKLRREGVSTCPICRKTHSPQLRASPSRAMKEFVDTLWVFCRHRDNGCPWNGELRFFNQHLHPSLLIPNAGCPFQDVTCTYRCGKKMPRWQIQQHQMDQCHKRPLLLRLGELEQKMSTKMKVSDGGSSQDSQKKRDGELQRQLSAVKKQIKEELDAYKEEVSVDCLRLREKINAQEAKLRDLKPKTDQFREIHRELDQLRGELHSMRQQLSSISKQHSEPPPPPPTPKMVSSAPNCNCPKLKEEVYKAAEESRQQVEQLRREFSTVKQKIATNALHERSHSKTKPANFKHELEQMKKHVDQEIEKTRQEIQQEKVCLYRERMELEQKIATYQPRYIADRILANATFPPMVVIQKDIWGSYESQDLLKLMRKSHQRYIVVEIGIAAALLVFFLAFLLYAHQNTNSGGVLKECSVLRNSFVKLRARVKRLEAQPTSVKSLEHTISRLKLTLLGLQSSSVLANARVDDLWSTVSALKHARKPQTRPGIPVSGSELVTDLFTKDEMCLPSDNPSLQSALHDVPDVISSQSSSPDSASQPSYQENLIVETSSVSDVITPSATEVDRRAVLGSPALAIFQTNTPSVLPSTNSLPDSMTPLVQKLWEVMRVLPPLDFIIANVDDYVETGIIWQTERFYTGKMGYSMSMTATIDQIGPNEEEDTYLSVYVHLCKGYFDDELKWPFTGYVILQIVNWEDEHSHFEWTIRFTGHGAACARVIDGERAEKGTGLENFVSLAVLKEKRDGVRFWKKDDDSIKLRIQNIVYP